MATIGETLRSARNERGLSLQRAEADTKIRPRYLKALEDEEWEVLPESAYVRGFLRTYAGYLGLDGDRLVDDYRRQVEGVGTERPGDRQPRPVAQASERRLGRIALPAWAIAGLVVAAFVCFLVVLGSIGGGGTSAPPTAGGHHHRSKGGPGADGGHVKPPAPVRRRVALGLSARGDVWVCVLDSSGAPVLDGVVLPPGSTRGPYRSGAFTVAFGNGAVDMRVNGKPVPVRDTPNPVGYSIAKGGGVTLLSEAERPTCS